MPTAAIMRNGENLLYSRKEQCLALGTQLLKRARKRTKYQLTTSCHGSNVFNP
jgi:hypothetical protein